MNCDKCGAPSVYHSTFIVNGISQTTNLCRDCAIKEGVFTQKTNMFEDLFSSFSDLLSFEKVENVVCPVCKTSLKEFKSTAKLGCPNCYEAFREEISSIIKRVAPFERHQQETIKTKQPKQEKISIEEQIRVLREDMKQAVAEERYEDAAKIKKQITKLESANE